MVLTVLVKRFKQQRTFSVFAQPDIKREGLGEFGGQNRIRTRVLARALTTRPRNLHRGYLLHSQLQYSSQTNRILCFFFFFLNTKVHVFAGKKLKPQRSSRNLFSLQTHLGTYEHLYSFERLLNDFFRAIVAFVINRII